MKLRNKKTGEIVENAYVRESHDFYNKRTISVFVRDGNRPPERVSTGYESLAELNEEWEDAPDEPKEYWYVSCDGRALKATTDEDDYNEKHNTGHKQIGNYFETEEEAEKAVEKLKAWERLKNKCFRFYRWNKGSLLKSLPNTIEFACDDTEMWTWEDIQDDLDLLFSQEDVCLVEL